MYAGFRSAGSSSWIIMNVVAPSVNRRIHGLHRKATFDMHTSLAIGSAVSYDIGLSTRSGSRVSLKGYLFSKKNPIWSGTRKQSFLNLGRVFSI